MIQPRQEFQLREQMIGRRLGMDLQTKVLIEKLVLQHHIARRTIQQPGALQQGAARLRQPGLKQIDIERPQLLLGTAQEQDHMVKRRSCSLVIR
jgi:hypothetical protein